MCLRILIIWFSVQVGVVNFNPYYRVYDPQHAIQQRSYASNMYQITCPVDVLSSDVQVSNMVGADENYACSIAKVHSSLIPVHTQRGGGRYMCLDSVSICSGSGDNCILMVTID